MSTEKPSYNVSRETMLKLKSYEASLNEWQQKFNLVSPSTIPFAWERHFLDSMQLFEHIPSNAKSLVDIGSGAGFPGMVLAIMAAEATPYLKVFLVESVVKKTAYLKHVAELTKTNIIVINDRVEKISQPKADVITARALASLEKLFALTANIRRKDTLCLFQKGKSYMEEIQEAQKHWSFNYEAIPSQTSSEGVTLKITNIHRKGEK